MPHSKRHAARPYLTRLQRRSTLQYASWPPPPHQRHARAVPARRQRLSLSILSMNNRSHTSLRYMTSYSAMPHFGNAERPMLIAITLLRIRASFPLQCVGSCAGFHITIPRSFPLGQADGWHGTLNTAKPLRIHAALLAKASWKRQRAKCAIPHFDECQPRFLAVHALYLIAATGARRAGRHS